MTMTSPPTASRRNVTERSAVTDEDIAALKAMVPGMGMMDYRSALANTKDLPDAADWLRHIRISHI